MTMDLTLLYKEKPTAISEIITIIRLLTSLHLGQYSYFYYSKTTQSSK